MDSDMMDAAGLQGRPGAIPVGSPDADARHHHHHQNLHHYQLNHHLLPDEQHVLSTSSQPNFQYLDNSEHTLPTLQHDLAAVNPDDFYTSYRAHYPDTEPLDHLPMASSSSSRPSGRSNSDSHANGHSGTSKQTEQAPNRTLPRASNLRSVSSPLGSKPGATRSNQPSSKTSVKDLKKRFDQGDTASSAIPRVPQPTSTHTRSRKDGSSSSKSRQHGQQYSTLRGGGASHNSTATATATASSRAHRSKYAAEDQVSQNVQSFATRVGKPRTLTTSSANSNPVNSTMAHLSPASSPPSSPSSPSAASLTPSQGLLFGEILPAQYDTSALGFGIEAVRPRGAPEADGHSHWAHQRSLSDPDVTPPPPEDWYHTAAPKNADANPRSRSSHPPSRDRSSSFNGHAKEKTSQRTSRKPASRKSTTSQNPPPAASKLPRSVRKLNSPHGSSSTSSTRSNSPSTTKRPHANGRTSRATTPTTRTTISRAKTPTQPTSGRKAPPPGLLTPNSNTRLQAYITTPPPKLSPPLRSSRPRQPVSSATTASSRMRAVDKSNGKSVTLDPKQSESTTRPRKISVGPIDFEQRREHIRLAYTKSLRESQALEARQRAAEKRRKEMEAAARAKVAAEAAAVSATAEPAEQTLEPRVYERVPPKINTDQGNGRIIPITETPTELPIVIADDLSMEPYIDSSPTADGQPTPDLTTPIAETPMNTIGSPDLGVPGSFPALSPPMEDDEVPMSAVTATSETTEFDIEPQEDISIQPESPVMVPIAIVKTASPPPAGPRSEYQYPFEEDELSPLDQSALVLERASEHEGVVASEERATPHLIPGAFEDADEDYRKPVHETTVTILPPQDDVADPPVMLANTVPFPRLELQDDSDCLTDLEDAPQVSSHHDPGDATTDGCSEDSDDHNRMDDCQSESRFGDQPSSQIASSCASSDAGDDYVIHHQQLDPSQNLMVPTLRSKRESQQSAWTDLSVESSGLSNVTVSPDPNGGDLQEQGSPTYGHVTIFGSQVLSRDSETPSKEIYDETASPALPYSSAESSTQLEQHQFTDADGGQGDGPSIPYLSQGQSVSLPYVPFPPDHDPPPIPTAMSASDMDSRRASSAFYEHSQYDSTLVHSDRGSEEFMSQLETPQTDSNSIGASEPWPGAVSQTSIEVKAVAEDGEELSDKERHRLVQRRNVIKEFVDTEAVFVRDMNIVEEIYKGTAEACPKLEDKTVKQIFRNTDEIIEFHTVFLAQLKDNVSNVYVPKGGRSFFSKEDANKSELKRSNTVVINDAKDRTTAIGPVFRDNIERMKAVHETFLRSSDQAARKLIQIQQDPTVKVWLNECNEVAKELTAAWDLDSLLIKPMQRITKYPNLILTLLQHTPADHPDRELLMNAKDTLETAIIEINQTKKNFELVGQIVGRQRKGSDVKTGFARAFGKRVDKLQPAGARPPEDPVYAKLNEKFGDDYLRLQVVLRDVEFYTRQATTYVREFLNYLSSIELVMRLQPGSFPEIESKWVQFNISVRDLEKVTLDDHLAQVRKLVIEPFEQVIKAYGNPSLAMKKRQKRRLDYERMEQLKRAGKTGDARLIEQVEQYEALNDTLKKELPKLSALTERMGNICLGNFVNIQAKWYGIWKEKMRTVLGDCPDMPEIQDIVESFERDFPYVREQVASIGIVQPTIKGRVSQSTAASIDDGASRIRSPRPSDVDVLRSRTLSVNDDAAPSLPTPDFLKRDSGSLSISPTGPKPNLPSPQQYYKDYYAGLTNQASSNASMGTLDMMVAGTRSPVGTGAASTRPSTGRSFESGGFPRQSVESSYRRDSNTTYSSAYQPSQDHRRFSGLFHSALPMPDGPEDSRRSSRASSQERAQQNDGYNVLWLAASLFEFNIATTKHEAGYPYLIYQAGEIFDVIAEKGELWLAKNQDDPRDQVGWIWSKHFAKLADS